MTRKMSIGRLSHGSSLPPLYLFLGCFCVSGSFFFFGFFVLVCAFYFPRVFFALQPRKKKKNLQKNLKKNPKKKKSRPKGGEEIKRKFFPTFSQKFFAGQTPPDQP